MTRLPWKRGSAVMAAVALAAGVAAGCGGGDGTAPAAEAGVGVTVTSPSAEGAGRTVLAPLSDGSTAVVAAYLPVDPRDTTPVRAKVGDLVALVVPAGGTGTAQGGSAEGTIVEPAGQGPAVSTETAAELGEAFTYRITAAGSGTLEFLWELPGRNDFDGTTLPGRSTTLTYALTTTE